jgi:energy-coupling factor transporter ATP-binding protein EcfA2
VTDTRRPGAARLSAEYSSLGLRIRIRCDDAEISRGLDDLYGACRRPTHGTPDIDLEIASSDPNGFELRADGELVHGDIHRHEVLAWCAWSINNLATERSPHLVLHAAVAERDGWGVILTGPSGSGKSTLVGALVLAGMSYLTDDSVAVDGDATQIYSNPKPIALDRDSCRALSLTTERDGPAQAEKLLFAPRSLGVALDAECRCTPALIVRPRFRPGRGTAVAPLAPAEAAELLADQSFNFAADGSAGLRAVAALGRSCAAIVVEYGDVAGAVDAITSALAAHTSPRVPLPSNVAMLRPTHPDLDVEILGEEALIWHRGARELHRLSPAATAIWLAAQSSSANDVLGKDALADVEACIDELKARGLLGS